MSLFRRQLDDATVQRARVLDVNVTNYTLVVQTELTQKTLAWVSWSSPYMHPHNGEGIYFMPEVGSICWLMEPSDGGMPFVVGWTSLPGKDRSHRNRRLDLNPGDIYLGTRDENHILLRRGGVVEIGATPLAQRLFLPINNMIKDLCANYSLQTLGGELKWTVGIPEENSYGDQQTTFTINAKEKATDVEHVATVQIGSHGADEPTILSLVLRASGDAGAIANLTVTGKKSGDLDLKSEGKITWKVTGDVKVDAKNITLTAKQKAALIGTQVAEMTGGLVNITSKSGAVAVAAAGGMVVSTSGAGPALTAGKGATEKVLLATPELLAWLQSHVHNIIAPVPNTPTSTPVPPLVGRPANNLKAS
jgi:hypothetical protein